MWVDFLPLTSSLLQLVFEHKDLFLQGQLLALGVPQFLAQGFDLGAVLPFPARQLFLVQDRLLFQVPPQAAHLLGLVCGRHSGGGAGLLQLDNGRNRRKMKVSVGLTHGDEDGD